MDANKLFTICLMRSSFPEMEVYTWASCLQSTLYPTLSVSLHPNLCMMGPSPVVFPKHIVVGV